MPSVAIILPNLRAEGGPVLAADLAAGWRGCAKTVAVLLDSSDLSLKNRFDELGIPIVHLGLGPISIRQFPKTVRAIRGALIKLGATAVVSIPTGVHGPLFVGAAMAGIKKRVVHMGNYPWHWKPDFWKYRLLMKLAAPVTPDLVCVTNHVAEGVHRHFGRVARNLHIIPNGIDLSTFRFRGETRPSHTRKALMVARLDHGKDHATLIAAIRLLRDRCFDITLELVGEGELRSTIEAQVASLGLNGIVRLLGVRHDIPNLLAEADVFVFSVRSEEGLGIALVEAMAVGIPIVATNVGACHEVLDGGACGLLTPASSPIALADAIEAATLQDDTRMVRAARLRAEKVYSRTAMAEGYGKLVGL